MHRFIGNPILSPNAKQAWQSEAAFNGCVAEINHEYHMVYRALSKTTKIGDKELELSTIGTAVSRDRIHFQRRRQLIVPEADWEKYGCEDPRITYFEGNYYIFYTALSDFPPSAQSIKVAVGITKDMQSVPQRHLVTPFNAKAMALFPQRIGRKLTAVLTVHTDLPPAKICIAQFDRPEEMWDAKYWERWYAELDLHTIPLLRSSHDHIEVGAVPVLTHAGWLLVYCYISNYVTSNKLFGVEAVLLDRNNPQQILGRTQQSLLTPEAEYELHGKVPNVIFPSGVLIHNNDVGLYYGAADTSVCLATCNADALLKAMLPQHTARLFHPVSSAERFSGNPIISPIVEHSWEDRYTFNPTVVYLDHKVHILYRAMGKYETSVIGYATSSDGVHIDERLQSPIYMPRENFERKIEAGYSGCEDPRLTKLGTSLYMCYTAYDGKNPTRVALTSISVADFTARNWNWSHPQVISPPDQDDKNACLFPEKINGKYVFFHRLHHCIWIDFVDSLIFDGTKWLAGEIILKPRPHTWYSEKIGIGPPPIKTDQGWVLICHGLAKEDNKYRLGAVLLNRENPAKVESILTDPILSPRTEYESQGMRPGTVFSCGAVILKNQLLIYYGAADQTVCVASMNFPELVNNLILAKN